MSDDIKEMNEDITSDKTSEEASGVFSSFSGEAALSGSEYIGSFDELLKSLGITPITPGDMPEYPEEEDIARQQVFVSEKPQQEYVPYNEDTYLENATRESKAASQGKRFTENFRVLSKKANDKTLLEAAPTGQNEGNVADSVKPQEGEDIFEAVERVHSKKKKGYFSAKDKGVSSILEKANQRKKEEVEMKANQLKQQLYKKLARQKSQLIVLGVAGFFSLVFFLLPSLYVEGGPLEVLFADGGRVYAIVNIAFLLIAAIAGFDRILAAFRSIKSFKPDSNTGLFLLFILVTAHSLVLLFLEKAQGRDISFYTLYAVFSLIVAVFSERLKTKTAVSNLKLVAKGISLDSIHVVENKFDNSVLGQGINKKGSDKLLYCGEAEAVTGLNGDLGKRTGEDKFYTLLHFVLLVAGLIAGIIIIIRSRDASLFITAIVACLCLCGPTMCEAARSFLLMYTNKKLHKASAAITAYDGIKNMQNAAGVAMDASDVFMAKVQKFRAVKGSRLSTHDCAVLTAATLKETDSLIAKCFSSIEAEIEGVLPEAEELEYIHRKGFSCKCAGRSVLVGNRKLLMMNDIEVPDKKEEKQYGGNRCVMYVAVDGILSATFLVSYSVLPSLGKAAVDFNKSGLVLLMTSCDPSLTENLASLKLGADISSVKILSPEASELIDEYRLNKSMRQTNSLVCLKRKRSVFNLAVTAKRLCDSDKFVLYMHVAGQALAFIMLLLAVVLNVPAFFNPVVIILLQLLWSALAVLLVTK